MSEHRLWGRLASLFGFARITATTALEGRGLRRAQLRVDSGEVRDDTPLVGQVGVSSRPLPGADAVLIFLNGDRSRGIVIATNDARYQIELAPGEVALHDDQGQSVHLRRSGEVRIKALVRLEVDAPQTDFAGDITVAGKSFLQHRHPETGSRTGVPE